MIIVPRVLYDNVFFGGSITSTVASGDGTDDSEAFDWLDYTFRTVAATTTFSVDTAATGTIDYAALYAEGTSDFTGTFAVDIEDSPGAGTFTNYVSEALTGGELLRMWALSSSQAVAAGQEVRVIITVTTGSIKIRNAAAGKVLASPIGQKDGIMRASFAGDSRYDQKMSINGSILGRQVIRQEKSQEIMWEYLSDTYLQDEWQAFAKAAETHAFFYAWDNDRFPQEVSFAVAESVGVPMNMSNPNCRRVTMQIKVLVAEY